MRQICWKKGAESKAGLRHQHQGLPTSLRCWKRGKRQLHRWRRKKRLLSSARLGEGERHKVMRNTLSKPSQSLSHRIALRLRTWCRVQRERELHVSERRGKRKPHRDSADFQQACSALWPGRSCQRGGSRRRHRVACRRRLLRVQGPYAVPLAGVGLHLALTRLPRPAARVADAAASDPADGP